MGVFFGRDVSEVKGKRHGQYRVIATQCWENSNILPTKRILFTKYRKERSFMLNKH